MNNQKPNEPELQGRELREEEAVEMRQGMDLEEMTKGAGWQVLLKWLEDRAYHSWIDPRTIEGEDAKKEWEWRELNAFHSADVAKQLINDIQEKINRAHYLHKVRTGEIVEAPKFAIGRT